jgi:GT2 family glycosyltransferase/glycosyltransferase involved in cell wall biosynthesis
MAETRPDQSRGLLARLVAGVRRRLGWARDARLIRASGVFDEAFYLREYPDVAESGERALVHFVQHGAAEGRKPSAYFDTGFYSQQCEEVLRQTRINPLVHFILTATLPGANPNPFFNCSFYLATHRAAIPIGVNPLSHYLQVGWRQGLNPSAIFDVRKYLNANPDVRDAGAEPLGHYLQFGLAESRAERPDGGVDIRPGGPSRTRKAAPLKGPSAGEWDRLAALHRQRVSSADRSRVDVIIPVYKGHDETLACIYSAVHTSSQVPHQVVVIDDASPDESLSRELVRLRELGLIELVVNRSNLGFVRTCNRGMSLHPDRDVVLLNSDAEVYGNWLDRLYQAAWSRPRVATVTPFSNNAEICSYPNTVFNNDFELELSYAELDAAAARVNAGRTVELPTGVGFCMYIRRDCLQEVGAFDEERFGRGYGENDFCLRSTANGYVNLLACDVFVRHAGGISFGPDKAEGVRRAQQLLHERFPDYSQRVQEFVSRDPAQEFRSRIDFERLRRRLRGPVFAFVMHNVGGGTERHVQELSRALESEGIGVIFILPDRSSADKLWLVHPEVWPLPNLRSFESSREVIDLAAALEQLGVAHLHVHHLLGTNVSRTDWVAVLAAKMGIRYDVTAHDYFPICPRITLVGGDGKYCNEPDAAGCDRCLRENGSPIGFVEIGDWRRRFARLVLGARAVFAPSKDTLERYRRYFPGARLELRYHAELPAASLERISQVRREPGEPLRVAIIGALVGHKGFDKVRELAEDAAARRLPVEFVVHGFSEDDEALVRSGKVKITGPYEDADLPRLLQSTRCHCALFPAVWPETYSYTLSHALRYGLYPVVTDLGALPERVRAFGWGTVIRHDIDARSLNGALLSLSIPAPPAPSALEFASYASVIKDYYQLPGLLPAADASAGTTAAPALLPSPGGPADIPRVRKTDRRDGQQG